MLEPLAPAPPARNLWRILLLAGTGLFVVWCAPRVKPVLWFGPLFGLMLGGAGLMLDRLVGASTARPRSGFAAVCAVAGCLAAFGLAIHNVHRHIHDKPKDALAQALIESLEQAQPGANTGVASFRTDWPSTAERYFMQRYRRLAGPSWIWLAVEAIAAGVIAGLLYWRFALRPAMSAGATP